MLVAIDLVVQATPPTKETKSCENQLLENKPNINAV